MSLEQMLTLLARRPSAELDVAKIALLLAQDEYPHLDVDGYLSELDAMGKEVGPYLRGDLESKWQGLCRYLFHELGFHGNEKDYYDPKNSYLNNVMERRIGIPISLSAVVMAVGKRAGLNVRGVGLPGHFIARIEHENRFLLFDPFHGGQQLSLRQCSELVKKVTGMDFEATNDNVVDLPLGHIVVRMLNNLKMIYLKRMDFQRAARIITRLRQIEPANFCHSRDLGVCWLGLEKPGRALDFLQNYLSAAPDCDDAVQVRQLLGQAQKQLAERN